jgi:hypothetical protein
MAFRGRPGTRSFGESTAGVPTDNSLHRLTDGAELHLTEAVGSTARGRSYHTPGSSPISPSRPTGLALPPRASTPSDASKLATCYLPRLARRYRSKRLVRAARPAGVLGSTS